MVKRATQQEVQAGPPAWVRELVEKYESGLTHAFVITGNIQDYVGGVPGQTLHSYLASAFVRREVVAFYNRSSGFSFPGGLPSNPKASRERSETMRQKFAQITGLSSAGGDGRVSIAQARLSSVPRGVATQTGALDEIKLEQIARQPSLALQKLGQVLHSCPTASAEQPEWAGTAVVLDYAETLAPASDGPLSPEDRSCYISLSEWGRDLSIAESGGIVILIVSDLSLLHEQLRKSGSRWEQIEIPFPTFTERAAFLRRLIREREIPLAEELDPEDIARITPGLRSIDLEDCALRALYQNQPLSLELVRQRKDEIIAGEFHDVLAVVDSDQGFESLGGLETVKAILRDYVITPMRQGHKRVVPQGMLWMGPPGTGKTRLALALAAEARVTFVELQPARIFSKFVGASERNLERALQAIKAMSPCIVFIDELDQLGSRGDEGDSGVSKRIFKRLMEVMADGRLRGEVLWVGCSNRPDRLDAALRRPGRLDEAIPILPPDEQERAEILELLSRQGFQSLSEQVVLPERECYRHLAAQTQGYTSAELELLVGQAIKLWVKSDQELVIADALQQALQLIIPATEDVELMTELALRYCNNLAFVPASYREQARLLRQRRDRQAVREEQDEDTGRSGRQARRF